MYFVVFRQRRTADRVGGAIIWSGWENKEEFEKNRLEIEKSEEVIAEGVSAEEAEKMTLQTPEAVYLHSAIEESVMPDGTVDINILQMLLQQKLMFLMLRRERLTE